MPAAPLPFDEADRIEALQSYELLDTDPEFAFDNIVRLAAQIAETPIALVSLVDSERQWFKARHGLSVAETDRDLAFCAHTILESGVLIVEDATVDPRFSDNALVTSGEQIRFYAGVPITASNGQRLGSLCVIDVVPRNLTSRQTDLMTGLAHQLEAHMDLRRAYLQAEAAPEMSHESIEQLSRELDSTVEGIKNANDLLAKSALDGDQQRQLELSTQATNHLTVLVEHIKSVATPPTEVDE